MRRSVPRRRRPGLSSMEAVLAFGVTFPIAVLLMYLGVAACIRLARVINGLVSWPYL